RAEGLDSRERSRGDPNDRRQPPSWSATLARSGYSQGVLAAGSRKQDVRGRTIRLAIGGSAFLLALGLAAGAWLARAPGRTPPGQPQLRTVRADTVAGLASRFDAARGKWRVVALLSPT